MRKRNIVGLLLITLMLLVAAPVALAQQGYTDAVFAVDQDVIDGTVRITRATVNGPGWVVIHADADGAPGPVIGYAEVMDGVNASIKVPVDVEGVTDTLFAMLHVDEGTVGEYEFPGPDVPVMVDDAPVVVPFVVTGITETTPEPTEEPVEEAAAAEEATPEPTEEAAEEAEATPEPTEEAAEEAEATPEPTEEAAEEAAEEAEATPEPTEEAAEEAEATPEPTEEAVEEAEAVMAKDLVDTAVEAGSFTTLVAAVQAAGLEDALRSEGPYTVFAPTDDAFAALPEGLLDALLQDPETLTQVLLYHVVPDKLMAGDVGKMGSAITLEGSMLEFGADGEAVMVNDAAVGATDIEASNGVIHVINSVLLPPAVQEAVAAAAEPEPEATPEPVQSIAASYQETDGTTVTVDSVESAGDGWVVIHAGEDFAPGAVLGHAAVPAGVSENVVVTLDEPLTEGGQLFAMLHVDDGEAGAYEFPDADPPAIYNRAPVVMPFNAVIAAPAEPEPEATPEPVQSIAASYQETDGATVTVDSVESAGDGWVVIHAGEDFAPGAVLGHAAVPAGVSENVVVTLDEPLTEGGQLFAMLHVDDGEAGAYEFPDADPPAIYNRAPVVMPFNAVIAGMEPAEVEATPEPTEEPAEEMTEATPEPTEEMAEEMAEATPEPTEEMAEEMAEATPEPTEEMAEEMAEATPEPTEEMAEEMTEATPEPTEEMAEEMAEATPEPTEEMAEEMTEATPEPTEEMAEEMAEATPEPTEEMAEEMAAPAQLPETGGALGSVGTTLPTVLLVVSGLVAAAYATRRRQSD